MNRKNDVMLEALAAEIRPVTGNGLLRRYGVWMLLVACLAGVLAGVMTRPGLAERVGQPDFVLQFGFWLAVVVVAGGNAFVLATPRWPLARGVIPAMAALLIGLTCFGAWLVVRLSSAAQKMGAPTGELACVIIVSAIGLLTAGGMVVALGRQAKPTYPTLMALMMALAGAGAGMLAIMLVCPQEEAGHVLVSHFLPAMGMGVLVALVGRKWWRW